MGLCKPADQPKYITDLIYGDNRTGKTYLLGTSQDVPECQPSLIIDADNGYETLRRHFPAQDIYTFDSSAKMQKHIRLIPEIIKKGGFKTVFLDTLSTFTFNLIEEISGGGAIQIQHWNQLFRDTLGFIRDIKEVAQIFIATSFPTWITDKEGNNLGVTPLIQGKKFPTILMNEFNIISFMSVKNVKDAKGDRVIRSLKSEANGFSVAGDRFSALGTIENPTFAKLYEKIMKGEN